MLKNLIALIALFVFNSCVNETKPQKEEKINYQAPAVNPYKDLIAFLDSNGSKLGLTWGLKGKTSLYRHDTLSAKDFIMDSLLIESLNCVLYKTYPPDIVCPPADFVIKDISSNRYSAFYRVNLFFYYGMDYIFERQRQQNIIEELKPLEDFINNEESDSLKIKRIKQIEAILTFMDFGERITSEKQLDDWYKNNKIAIQKESHALEFNKLKKYLKAYNRKEIARTFKTPFLIFSKKNHKVLETYFLFQQYGSSGKYLIEYSCFPTSFKGKLY